MSSVRSKGAAREAEVCSRRLTAEEPTADAVEQIADELYLSITSVKTERVAASEAWLPTENLSQARKEATQSAHPALVASLR